MSPHPGEVWLADLGLAAKTRPVVIVSRHDPTASNSQATQVLQNGQTASGFGYISTGSVHSDLEADRLWRSSTGNATIREIEKR